MAHGTIGVQFDANRAVHLTRLGIQPERVFAHLASPKLARCCRELVLGPWVVNGHRPSPNALRMRHAAGSDPAATARRAAPAEWTAAARATTSAHSLTAPHKHHGHNHNNDEKEQTR